MAKKKPAKSDIDTLRLSGNYLREWRLFRGYESQGKLAIASGITRATICRLESGALPYRQWLLEKLATTLDCEPGDLITTDPNEKVTIVRIYRSLPDADKKRAIKYLEKLAGK